MPVPSTLTLQPDHTNEKTQETTGESSPPASPSPPDSPRSSEELVQNKLFVGALSWETKEDTLKSYFSKFGEVVDCSLMLDGMKRSRGFAFVTFKETESVQNIIDKHAKDPLKVDDKIIDPKLAVPRRGNKVRRIFVGGLSSDTSEEDMRDFFEQFGEIEEVQLMYDRQTNRHRGFGFVTFEKVGPAEKVCSIQYHDLKGKKVEVKVAQTKEALAMQAGKARTAAAFTHGYGAAAPFNYSPTYPPFYSPFPIDIYSPQMMMGGKPRAGTAGVNKMRLANQYSPPAFFGGYSYSPTDHPHITSPPYFSGFNGIPSPFFMRGPDPTSLPLGSPPMDFIEQFQALTMIGNPYTGMSPGSPPNNLPVTALNNSFTYQNGDSVGANYSPPNGISPKGGSPTGTPINGYTQVPSYSTGKSSYPIQQQTSA